MYQKLSGLLRHEKVLTLLVMVVFTLPGAFASSVAAEEKPAESGWEFTVAPYLWAVSMNGNLTVRGLKADLDVSFNDIWDELNFAFMLAYEARKGHWGLWGNTIYADLGDSDVDGPDGLTEIDPTVKAFW
jgi:hypothetical protein